MYEKYVFLRKGIVCVGQFQKSVGFLDEFVALVFHFSPANSQQNCGMIWHRSGVIEDKGQLIDKILS